jgi:hypothetical protein
MSIDKARKSMLSGLDGPNPFRDRSLSNPEGINQYTKGGGGSDNYKGRPGEASRVEPQRFKGPHGGASVRVVSGLPHSQGGSTHAGSVRLSISQGDGSKYVYHTKDPQKALDAAKVFVNHGHDALIEHWNADKQGTGKAQASSGSTSGYPGPIYRDKDGIVKTIIPSLMK